MIYGWFYRNLMKLAHRYGWHKTRTCYPDGDTLLVCDWCGLRYVKHRRNQVYDFEPIGPASTRTNGAFPGDVEGAK